MPDWDGIYLKSIDVPMHLTCTGRRFQTGFFHLRRLFDAGRVSGKAAQVAFGVLRLGCRYSFAFTFKKTPFQFFSDTLTEESTPLR